VRLHLFTALSIVLVQACAAPGRAAASHAAISGPTAYTQRAMALLGATPPNDACNVGIVYAQNASQMHRSCSPCVDHSSSAASCSHTTPRSGECAYHQTSAAQRCAHQRRTPGRRTRALHCCSDPSARIWGFARARASTGAPRCVWIMPLTRH